MACHEQLTLIIGSEFQHLLAFPLEQIFWRDLSTARVLKISAIVQGLRGGSLAEEAVQTMQSMPVYSMLSNASSIVETLRAIPEVVLDLKLDEASQKTLQISCPS